MTNILGVKLTNHDVGAALIAGDKIVAIADERLSRIKHSPRKFFPRHAIPYCLNALNIKPEEIDHIVADQTGMRSELDMEKIFRKWDKKGRFSKAKFHVVSHHDAHAASAFFCSPFKEAAVLVYDGYGETFLNQFGIPVRETETLYHGTGSTLIELQKTAHDMAGKKIPSTFGIGRLYELLSRTYLNFGDFNEGKMMGLAGYGTDRILKQFPPHRWFIDYKGHILCNSNITFPPLKMNVEEAKKRALSMSQRIRRKYYSVLRFLAERFLKFAYKNKRRSFVKEPEFFKEIHLPRPPRGKDGFLPDEYYSSIAYAGQELLEQIAVKWGERVKELSRSENLCIAGGVGLNIDANRNFLEKVGFRHIWVQPAASDTGIALGCALYGAHMILKQPRFWEMKSASLGRLYSDEEIENALHTVRDNVTVRRSSNAAKEAAQLIADGNIIGWFHGGAEYGPRALGNRSILCDASRKDVKDTLNNKVKHREPWRPFATSILAEHQSEWFELEEPSPFMLFDAPVREEKKKLIPSIVHVDGTCRIQAVTKEQNRRYYDLLSEFKELTGLPLVLNTSFNLGGEPIVETPEDAIRTFLNTKMDYLILEDFIVRKKG